MTDCASLSDIPDPIDYFVHVSLCFHVEKDVATVDIILCSCTFRDLRLAWLHFGIHGEPFFIAHDCANKVLLLNSTSFQPFGKAWCLH